MKSLSRLCFWLSLYLLEFLLYEYWCYVMWCIDFMSSLWILLLILQSLLFNVVFGGGGGGEEILRLLKPDFDCSLSPQHSHQEGPLMNYTDGRSTVSSSLEFAEGLELIWDFLGKTYIAFGSWDVISSLFIFLRKFNPICFLFSR